MSSETTPQLNKLADIYHDYENRIRVFPAPQDGSYKSLVTFDSCKDSRIHRWYTYKEGFSNKLLNMLQLNGVISSDFKGNLLDPFCGVGTTLLSSQIDESVFEFGKVTGVERNPTVISIAKAKLDWHLYDLDSIKFLLEQLSSANCDCKNDYSLPPLSTLTAVRRNGKRAFEPDVLAALMFYKKWIYLNCTNSLLSNFFSLAWTSIIEQASNTRKDGRALRLLDAAEPKDVKKLFIHKCQLMLEDLEANKNKKPVASAKVILGDGRRLPFCNNTFTALCYSPPYLNNIDYSEVYKLELWLRGDVSNYNEFYSLRKGTFRSHPSIKFPKTTICDDLASQEDIRQIKKSLIEALPDDNFKIMREALFSGYIDDILITLEEQARVATSGAPIVCVVGNSLHGGKDNPTVPVCTDLIIAAAAQTVGLEIDHLQIARQLPRRDSKNGWLRETIIVMRKP